MNISELVGKSLSKIDGLEVGNDTVTFYEHGKPQYRMYHSQGCCEAVNVESIDGDVSDLLHSPILTAYEDSSAEGPVSEDEFYTWTFYRLSTIKGTVTIRWYGESNGYYSESVDFEEVKNG